MYNLGKLTDKKYNLSFEVTGTNQARVAFEAPDDGVLFVDEASKPVHEIDSVSPKDVYTIVIR